MPKPSEHDLVVERKRDEAREALIDHYIQIAIAQSDDYGFLNVMGHEVPDPTIMEPPLGYIQQPDLITQMRNMMRTELSRIASESEFETLEEADDFDIDDDPVDYTSPYEEFFDPPPGAPTGPPGESKTPPGEEPPPKPPETPAGAGEGGGAAPTWQLKKRGPLGPVSHCRAPLGLDKSRNPTLRFRPIITCLL